MTKLLTLTLFILFFPPFFYSSKANADTNSRVIINEILPNPTGSDTFYEWIELKNTSNEAINLNGWKIDTKIIPQYTIEPNSFLLIARNSVELLKLYPTLDSAKVIQLDISLNNSGENLELINSDLILEDSLTYASSIEGQSISKKGILCTEVENTTPTMLSQNTNYSEECNEVVNPAPQILNIVIWDKDHQVADLENLSASQTYKLDFELNYDFTTQINSIEWKIDEQIIPIPAEFNFGQRYLSQLSVNIILENSETISYNISDITTHINLQITELTKDSQNVSWIEILNTELFAINLENISLLTNQTHTQIWNETSTNFLENTCTPTLEPNEYCIVEVPVIASSVDIYLADTLISPNLFPQISETNIHLSLINTSWYENIKPTPAIANAIDYKVILTEVYPSPLENETEWIELFNPTEYNIPILGILCLDLAGNKCFEILEDIVIASNSYYQILASNLNNASDTIYLKTPTGEIFDSIRYLETVKGKSTGRKLENGIYQNMYTPNLDIVLSDTLIPTPLGENKFPEILPPEEPEEEPEENITEDLNIYNIANFSNLQSLNQKYVYAEGKITNNYGATFDILANNFKIRVTAGNTPLPTKTVNDTAQITGKLIFDGTYYRLYPRNANDIIIVKNITATSAKVTAVKATASTATAKNQSTIVIKNLKSLPTNFFEIKQLEEITQQKLEPENVNYIRFMSFIFFSIVTLGVYQLNILNILRSVVEKIFSAEIHTEKVKKFKKNPI